MQSKHFSSDGLLERSRSAFVNDPVLDFDVIPANMVVVHLLSMLDPPVVHPQESLFL